VANFRILNDNAADRAVLTASSTLATTSAANLKTNKKGEFWGATAPTSTLNIAFSNPEKVGLVALPICNLSPAATVRVRCYSDVGQTSQLVDSGNVLAVAAPLNDYAYWSTVPNGVNGFAYGSGRYAIVWLAQQISNVMSVRVDIVDAVNAQCSRLVVGAFTEFMFNADNNPELQPISMSVQSRSDAGDVLVDRGPISKSMNINFSIMSILNRKHIYEVFMKNGLDFPVFISLVPGASDKTLDHQLSIYGFFSKLSATKLTNFSIGASSISIDQF
jgi:hypothetical protein